MLLLTSTSDKLRLTTSAAASIDVQASWVDYFEGAITPGRTNTAPITTGVTTDIVAAPSASTQRNVKHISARNKHASASCDVTLIHTDGTNALELFKCTLAAGEQLVFNDGTGFMVFSTAGGLKTSNLVLASPVSVFAYKSTDTSLTHNVTSAAIAFDSEDWDTHGMHEAVTNPSRLTCVVEGKYDVKAMVRISDAGAGSTTRQVMIYKNGNLAGIARLPSISADGWDHCACRDINMVVGDYLELKIYQNSGSTLTLSALAGISPSLSAHLIR